MAPPASQKKQQRPHSLAVWSPEDRLGGGTTMKISYFTFLANIALNFEDKKRAKLSTFFDLPLGQLEMSQYKVTLHFSLLRFAYHI